MSLQKQLVHLNMSGGLEKKDDSFLTIPSKLAVADNVQFDDASTVVRRGGQASVSLSPLGPYGPFTLGQAARAFSHQGVPHLEGIGSTGGQGGIRRVQKSGGTTPVINPSTASGFTSPFQFRRAGMTTARIGGVNQKATAAASGAPLYDGNFDCAVLGNLTCYVWESKDTAGSGLQSVRLVVVDDSTGFRLYDTLLSDGTNQLVKPRVVASAAQNKFFIYVASFAAATVNYAIKGLTVSSVGAVTAFATVTTDATTANVESAIGSECLYDVAFSADAVKLGIVYRSAGQFKAGEISTTDGTTFAGASVLGTSATPTSLTAIITYDATNYRLHAIYGINTNVLKAMHYNITAVSVSAESTVGTAAVGTKAGRVAAYEGSAAQLIIAWDSTTLTGSAYASTLRLSSCTHTYGTLTECASTSPWVIAGRIGVMSARLYLPMVFMSEHYQTTTFVIDLSSVLANLGVAGAAGAPPQVLARIDYGDGAVSIKNWRITHRVSAMPLRSTTLILPYLKFESDLRIAGITNDTAVCLSSATIDFASQLQHEETNGLTFLAGACPYIFDGSNYVEEGFHHGPEILSITVAVGTAGTYQLVPATAGTYTVCFTWAWQDAQGNWHESAPSNEMLVTATAANYSFTPTLTAVPTQKANAQLLMYRTKITSTDTSLYLAVNNVGTSVITDADLSLSEQLYTAGSVLPNSPAPACRHVSLWQRRLVLSGCGDGQRIHWSKQSDPGYGVEFSSGDPTHQTVVPADKGRVVATEEMDDRLVVICESGVGIIDGQGPNPSGTQGQYSDYRTIVTEVGGSWDSPKSVVRGPEGVWFRSPSGVRLVSRSGSLAVGQDGKQVGSEVDSLVSGTAVAVTGSAKQQLRIYQSSGTCLVWDYQWRQWTRFTGMASIDAVYADDRYYHLSNYSVTNPLLRYTDDSVSTDVLDNGNPGSVYSTYIETAWLSFAGIQGFQRIYRMIALGRNVDGSLNPVTFGISLNYDFDPTYTSDAPFVSVTPSTGGVVQLQHHFVKQKCEAIKIAVYFFPTAGAAGRFRLTDLTLQIGVKGGYFKQPPTARF